MKTLTYWKAKCRNDHDCYSLRAKTRKAVVELVHANGCKLGKDGYGDPCFVDSDDNSPCYDLPVKVTVQYTDLMGLVNELRSEGGSDY